MESSAKEVETQSRGRRVRWSGCVERGMARMMAFRIP